MKKSVWYAVGPEGSLATASKEMALAVEEGATLVRIGRAIFGEREK